MHRLQVLFDFVFQFETRHPCVSKIKIGISNSKLMCEPIRQPRQLGQAKWIYHIVLSNNFLVQIHYPIYRTAERLVCASFAFSATTSLQREVFYNFLYFLLFF